MPRRQKKHHYIYKTTCLVTGKFYVGMHSTDDLDDGYIGSGKILRYSIKKHGAHNHRREIIEICPSREALKLREKEIVNEQLLADPLNINLKYGGEGGFDHIPRDVVLRNLSKRNDGWAAYNKSDAARRKSSERMRNGLASKIKPYATFSDKRHTQESISKIAASMSGKVSGENNGMFGTCWVFNDQHSIQIKKDKLNEYLSAGYTKGRKMRTIGESAK